MGWIGWAAVYGVALVFAGGLLMKKLQPKRAEVAEPADAPPAQTVGSVIDEMEATFAKHDHAARESKLNEALEGRRTAAVSIDESLKLLALERGKVQAEREVLGRVYTLAWFEGDAAAGEAMVDVRVAVIDGEVRRLMEEKQRLRASMDAINDELKALASGKAVRGELLAVPGADETGTGWRFKQGEKISLSRLWPEMRKHPSLSPWLAARSLEEESDFSWYLLMRESGRGADDAPLPAVLEEVQPDSTGTGFWVSPDGYMVTNHHVVRGARAVVLRRESGQTVKATVVAEDEQRDLALLKAETSSPEWLALSAGVARQDLDVFTQGFPRVDVMGVEAKLERGFISSLKGFRDDPNTYQISMPVQPGNSGGALVHTNREGGAGAEMPWVVGVVVSRLNGAERVSYAIKSSVVVDFLKGVPAAAVLVTRPAVRPEASAVEHARKASCLVMVKTR